MNLHGAIGLVGGAYDKEKPGQAFVDLESDNLDTKGLVKAASMLEVLCWDPCGLAKCPLSVAASPLDSTLGGQNSQMSGLVMMQMVGEVLEKSGGIIKGITFDAHGSHQMIRRVLHGQLDGIDAEVVKSMPFFGKLIHVPLPKNDLPRLPIQICLYEKQVFYGQTGPCSLAFQCISLIFIDFHCILIVFLMSFCKFVNIGMCEADAG